MNQSVITNPIVITFVYAIIMYIKLILFLGKSLAIVNQKEYNTIYLLILFKIQKKKMDVKQIPVLFVHNKNPHKSPFLSTAELSIYVNKRIVLNFYFYIFSSITFYYIPYLISNLDSRSIFYGFYLSNTISCLSCIYYTSRIIVTCDAFLLFIRSRI